MNAQNNSTNANFPSRREFLKLSGGVAASALAGATLAGPLNGLATAPDILAATPKGMVRTGDPFTLTSRNLSVQLICELGT